jgi:phosphoglycerol transferase MdoB-like AlkP superfamily enzyme
LQFLKKLNNSTSKRLTQINTISAFTIQLFKLLVKILSLLIPVIAAYQVIRLLFFISNHSEYDAVTVLDFIQYSFYGFRFDLAAIAISNALVLLMLSLPGKFTASKYYVKLTVIFYMLFNMVCVLMMIVDIEYFKISHRRLTFDFLQVAKHDLGFSNVLSYSIHYWYLLLLLLLFGFVFVKIGSRKIHAYFQSRNTQFTTLQVFIVLLGIIPLIIVGARGGTQMRPITIANASDYAESQNTALVLNSTFTFINSSTSEDLQLVNYMSDNEAQKYFNPIHFLNHNKPFTKQNVVLIVLESFGKEYIGYFNGDKTATPFLDSLMNCSIVFTNAFANATRSIEGIPAILAAIPNNTSTSFIASPYTSNQITSIASLLKAQGYETSFYHGGRNGTMSFDSFTKLCGYDTYMGLNEYPLQQDFDGHWGIWDEEYLNYFSSELSKKKEPFFSTVFTLSSHDPYQIPEKYKTRFKEGKQPITKTIAYTDHALRLFFESAKQQPWFKNTLFVFTADHSTWTPNPIFQNSFGNLKIPIVMYAPGMIPQRVAAITQQIDILPTIMDYMHFDQSYFSLGKSSLSDTAHDVGFNYMNNQYQIFNRHQLIKFDGAKVTAVFDLSNDSLLQHNLYPKVSPEKDLVMYAKSYLQQYTSALVDNRMTIENYFRPER